MRKIWYAVVIGGLWAGIMAQFIDMYARHLLRDNPYVLIIETLVITLIAISGIVVKRGEEENER